MEYLTSKNENSVNEYASSRRQLELSLQTLSYVCVLKLINWYSEYGQIIFTIIVR